MNVLIVLSCVVACCYGSGVPGGYSKADISDPEIIGYANFFVSQYNLRTKAQGGNAAEYTNVQLVSANQQVVSGMNYDLHLRMSNGAVTQMCDVVIYVQPWTNTKRVDTQVCHPVTKRAGGYEEHSVDAEVMMMANFALNKMNVLLKQSNSLVRVVSASTQVVAGTNYKLRLELDQNKFCDVVVFNQPWTQTTQLTSNSCDSTKRQLGAPHAISKSDIHVQEVFTQAIELANGMSNNMYRLSAVSIEHVTKQVVAGMKYEFDMMMGESSCRNNGESKGLTFVNCPVKSGGMSTTFHVVGIWQSWMTPEYHVTVTPVTSARDA